MRNDRFENFNRHRDIPPIVEAAVCEWTRIIRGN